MSSHHDKDNNVIFECDQCGETVGGHESNFQDAWDDARSDGFTFNGKEHNCGCAKQTPKNDPYGGFR